MCRGEARDTSVVPVFSRLCLTHSGFQRYPGRGKRGGGRGQARVLPMKRPSQSQVRDALAVAGPTRVAIAPNVPTFAESGFPEYETFFYMGLSAPSSMPSAIINKIAADVAVAMKTEDMLKTSTNVGFQPLTKTPAQLAAFLVTDRANAAKRIEAAGLKME